MLAHTWRCRKPAPPISLDAGSVLQEVFRLNSHLEYIDGSVLCSMIASFVSGMDDCGNVYSIAGLYTDSYSIRVSSLVASVFENGDRFLGYHVNLSFACSFGTCSDPGFSLIGKHYLPGLGLVHPVH